jgi:hypothetical protein
MEQIVQVLIDFLASLGLPEAVIAAIGVVAGYVLKLFLSPKPQPTTDDETEIDG